MSERKKRRKQHYVRRVPKYRFERNLIKALETRIAEHAPVSGTNPISAPDPRGGGGYVGARRFNQLPISNHTLKALDEARYVEMTDIQRAALPHGLVGRDILGAAKTGSGKTLAFLITMLEKLYRCQWTKMDGLGALIISPVRELALQIFEELRKVGKYHNFSAGLLIGGKDVDVERSRVGLMNILIGTPGRLLHHLDSTIGLDVSHLELLVLDEADRLMDMGFARIVDAVVEHLPKMRQSMLFSATQTKSVKDLMRLSLDNPEFLAVHAEAKTATPTQLKQFYVTCLLTEKLTLLWSFIKTHPRSKIIVFVSTCAQVRFLYEATRRLLSHQHVCCLHGRIKQNSRTNTFLKFSQSKAMVLFATDVAARGLDFPGVDWVMQVDAPETVAEYIHRVGRTARYTADGQAFMLLLPQEQHFLTKLDNRQIPIKKMKLKSSAMTCPTLALQSLLTKNSKLKEVAKKALITYLKSYLLNGQNEMKGLDIEAFGQSLGLPTLPSSKSFKKIIKKIKRTTGDVPNRIKETTDETSDDEFFTIVQSSSTEAMESHSIAPPLLKCFAESWKRESYEVLSPDELNLDPGVCLQMENRFGRMRLALRKRTADDRAIAKEWKREAAIKSKDQNRLQLQSTVQLATATDSDDIDNELPITKKPKLT